MSKHSITNLDDFFSFLFLKIINLLIFINVFIIQVGIKVNCSVSIHVLDVNDNEPRFEKTNFVGYISETASVGSLVLLEKNFNPLVIRATDADTGVNSLLSYEILEERPKKYFAIDESTGALRTITALDYEEQKSFKFNVRVSDRGSPSLSSDSLARVTIVVLDENDCPPSFEKKVYSVVLLLPTFKDVLVAQVNASDPDVGIKTQLR
jgi:protocadherin Fat 1/2/3